jgi:F-type H+-transporting ATPase subunit c
MVPLLEISDDALKFVGAALAIGIGGLGPGQPVIQSNMILGVAFAEAIAIYALVVAIMIGFVF